MNIFRKALRRIVKSLAYYGVISSRRASVWLYAVELHRFPDLTNPRDLNEKVIWLEYNTDTTRWSHLADKLKVRKYVSSKGFDGILIPMLGEYDGADEIDFSILPESFVIKTNHAYANNIIVRNKASVNTDEIKKTLSKWLNYPFGKASGEPHYLRIKPRVMVESLLEGKDGKLPIDYKFMCFNGKVDSCLMCTERDSTHFECLFNLMDTDHWVEMDDSGVPGYQGNAEQPRPAMLKEMVEIAEKLSEGFPFVRVDLYEVDDKIYFGEMTFTPCGGRIHYLSQSTLSRMGDLINIKN